MELSEDHKAELTKFLEFFNRKREEAVQETELVADEFKEEVIEELYNNEDVKQMIDDLREKIQEHSSSEISNIIKLAGVYVKYCFSIAEQKGANIEINLNLIEDAKLKSQIGAIEGSSFMRSQSLGMKLPPVAYGNQMQARIEEYQNELKKSQEKVANLEKELEAARKAAENAGNSGTFGNVDAYKEDVMIGNAGGGDNGEEVNDLKMKVAELEQLLDNKISGSKQMQNFKKMLMSKNEKLKDYKMRLSKYENVE